MTETLYVVVCALNAPWSLVGVFTSEARAVAECLDESYFYGPVVVDAGMHGPPSPFPSARRPKVEAAR